MPLPGGERKARFSNVKKYPASCKVAEYPDGSTDGSIIPADEIERVFPGHFAGPSGIAIDTFRRTMQELKKTGQALPLFRGPGPSLRYQT